MTTSILRYFKKIALGLWLGTQGFFILGVAPSVFKTLDRPVAAKLMAEIFPRYFVIGSICGGIFLLLLFLENAWVRRQGLMVRFKFIPLSLALLATGCFLYCYLFILPQILEAQAALYLPGEAGLTPATSSSQFQSLHSQSTTLNGLALVALLILMFFV
jgi:hypothetical protein